MDFSKIAENVAWRSIRGQEIEDVRKKKTQPWNYVIMIDSFMSGWGKAPGRSYIAIAVDNQEEADIVMQNARKRSEMKSIRLRKKLPKVSEGDHLKVTDKHDFGNWFQPGAF